ncbi:MAG: 4Fe-4S binding protein [Lachnospiraceae bacterium]
MKEYYVNERCSACGQCISACSEKCITMDSKAHIDTSKCTDCGRCEQVCSLWAIKVRYDG